MDYGPTFSYSFNAFFQHLPNTFKKLFNTCWSIVFVINSPFSNKLTSEKNLNLAEELASLQPNTT